ncbi:MAG: hypothetical protein GY749_37225 [Desulfobacteraceae bacterium]|nr:hypothetical protein [Desulfobacteraceae bacterium]
MKKLTVLLTLALALLSVAVAWAELTEDKSELTAGPRQSPLSYDDWRDSFWPPVEENRTSEVAAGRPRPEPRPCPYDDWWDCFFWPPVEENRTSEVAAGRPRPELRLCPYDDLWDCFWWP